VIGGCIGQFAESVDHKIIGFNEQFVRADGADASDAIADGERASGAGGGATPGAAAVSGSDRDTPVRGILWITSLRRSTLTEIPSHCRSWWLWFQRSRRPNSASLRHHK
jgi:hypothetical protein